LSVEDPFAAKIGLHTTSIENLLSYARLIEGLERAARRGVDDSSNDNRSRSGHFSNLPISVYFAHNPSTAPARTGHMEKPRIHRLFDAILSETYSLRKRCQAFIEYLTEFGKLHSKSI